MKVFFAVFICRILYFIGKRLGRGSSLPGKVVLKVFPGVLRQLRLPEIVIAVTGSNGKTTTTELIADALSDSGMSVGWNHEGSNQTEGIATLLLRISSFGGKVKRDAIVMECDERYARFIFENVRPSVLLVTNLCRDQLTRNGHPEFIGDCIRAAIGVLGAGVGAGSGAGGTAGVGMRLVLNADDPYVAALAETRGEWTPGCASTTEGVRDGADVLWFGVSAESGTTERVRMYDDGAFCPVCKARMIYSYRIAGHYGAYSCAACGLQRVQPEVEAVMRWEDSVLSFGDGLGLKVSHPSLTNAYNYCAAVAVAKAVGIDVDDSVRALDGYEIIGGRVTALSVDGRGGLLLLSKHENSFAYDCSLSWIVTQKKPCTVIILVDAISRKYYTSETSWFWDIDFDLLADENVKNVVLAGRYVNELATRFALSAVDESKIVYVPVLDDLKRYVKENTVGDIYALTCFSDKWKLLKAFGV